MQMRRTHFHTVSRVVGYNAMFLSLSVLFVVKFVVCHLVFLKPEVTIFKHMQPLGDVLQVGFDFGLQS